MSAGLAAGRCFRRSRPLTRPAGDADYKAVAQRNSLCASDLCPARPPHDAPPAPSIVFEIRIATPVVTDEEGRRQALGVLAVGNARLPFRLDCTHWSASAYERQWKAGIRRIADGAPSSALLTAYQGDGDEPHVLWAMWRDDDHVYVQARSVRSAAYDAPFDPWNPYPFVPSRMPVGAYAPPPTQWRVELESFVAGAFGLRVPFFSGGPGIR